MLPIAAYHTDGLLTGDDLPRRARRLQRAHEPAELLGAEHRAARKLAVRAVWRAKAPRIEHEDVRVWTHREHPANGPLPHRRVLKHRLPRARREHGDPLLLIT